VDEHVLASIAGLDESVTLLGIEPFDSSRSHAGLLLTVLLKLEFQNRQFGRSEGLVTIGIARNVRYGSKADMCADLN
jgi:hypothetical protein